MAEKKIIAVGFIKTLKNNPNVRHQEVTIVRPDVWGEDAVETRIQYFNKEEK